MKGLESLIPHKKGEEDAQNQKESIFLIETNLISTNPYQPRRDFDEKALKDLADSIKTYGMLQPLIVSKIEEDTEEGRKVEYELIAGERRLRAAKKINLPRVPAVVKRSTNRQKLEVSLIENIQRNDLNALEEAIAYKRLQEEFGMKQSEIAKRVSKSGPYIANTLRILGLPDEIKDALAEGAIAEGHTRPLLRLKKPEQQRKLFDEIRKRNITVRQAESRARELLKESSTPKQSYGGVSKVDPKLEKLLDEFSDAQGLSDANVKTRGRKAQLTITFSSKEELRSWIKKFID